MKRGYARITGGAMIAIAIAALGVVVVGSQGWAQDEAEAEISVGTYDPQLVFNAYPGREQLMEQITEIYSQMQQAQQDQDQQRLMQLQEQMQQQRIEAIEQFQADVEQTLPAVAEASNIDLVAIDVVYSREGVHTRDITTLVIEELGGDPAPQQPQFMAPPEQ